jgi:hypothetical protein
MTKINDGGPAFPVAEDHKVADSLPWTAGMTLRDWFAGQALAALSGVACSNPVSFALAADADGFKGTASAYLAYRAFHLSDAMLIERDVTIERAKVRS